MHFFERKKIKEHNIDIEHKTENLLKNTSGKEMK